MVYEDVWLARPANAEHTKVLARLDDLPMPAFIVRDSLEPSVAGSLKAAILGMKPEPGPDTLYAGPTTRTP